MMLPRAAYKAAILTLLMSHPACSGPNVELLEPARTDASVSSIEAGAFFTDGGGDGGVPDLPNPALPGLMALRIDPPTLILPDDGVDPPEKTEVTAYGTFATGERDVTAEVGWSLADPVLGNVQAGTITSKSVGGTTQVFARAQGITATADVTFTLEVILLSDEGSTAGSEERSAPASDDVP